MKIALYHGYELSGSGSNQYNFYLAEALHKIGVEVVIFAREPHPKKFPLITHAYQCSPDGVIKPLYDNENRKKVVYYQLPTLSFQPVYLTDKQRPDYCKSFVELSDDDLARYIEMNEKVLGELLTREKPDFLYANHLVPQPFCALKACHKQQIPLVIFLHGSSIEYTVNSDVRYQRIARESLLGADLIISGNREVFERILTLFPDCQEVFKKKWKIVGIGVSTQKFQTIPKQEMPQAIASLRSFAPFNGKTIALSDDLYQKLAQKQYDALTKYRDAYKQEEPDQEVIEKLDSLDPKAPILAFVGAFTYGKGVHSLITAFPLVLEKYPDAQLIIIGSGAFREVLEGLLWGLDQGDIELVRYIADRGASLDRNNQQGGLADVQHFLEGEGNWSRILSLKGKILSRVHFLGRLSHDKLRFVFPLADLALFPSVLPEAYGLVLVESLASGVLPLVSYFSGLKDGVDELQDKLGDTVTHLMKLEADPKDRIVSMGKKIVEALDYLRVHIVKEQFWSVAANHYDWTVKAKELVSSLENSSFLSVRR